jgi:hypothetical protein
MYGYAYPRKPDLAAMRVRVSQSQVDEYRRLFPSLSRSRILDTMIAKGPWREPVEAELRRLARELAGSEG